MAEILKVNKESVEADGVTILNAMQYFTADTLSPQDNESTISANEKGKNAFLNVQQIKVSFSETLEQDVENIRSLGVEFSQFDEMMGNLNAIQ